MNLKEKINDDALVVHLTVNQIKRVIESVFQQTSSLSSNQPEIVDIEEVLKLTGYKKATIYKLIHERKIPFHKPAHGGRRIFFKSAEIDKWLQSNRIETNEEFSQKHRENRKGQSNDKNKLQRKLQILKSLLVIFTTFQNVINKYKVQIQELEEKVAKYETDNQLIENLFINEFINTNENENKRQ
jgi:excisionase family DNA binding protein